MTIEQSLSDREREILVIVAKGATNQDIAQKLNISIHTVKVHLRNIYSKIGVESRTEATLYAMRHGLVAAQTLPDVPVVTNEVAQTLPDVPVVANDDESSNDVSTERGLLAYDEQTADDDMVQQLAIPPTPQPAIPPTPLLQHKSHLLIFKTILATIGVLAIVLLAIVSLINRGTTNSQVTSPDVATAAAEANNRWRVRAALPNTREYFAGTVYDYGGKIYLIGGDDETGPSQSVERFDPTHDVWLSSLAEKPTAASHMRAQAIGDVIYVPGGLGKDGKILDVLEVYDPRTDQWSIHAPLPAPRSDYALAIFEGQLYLFGGWDGKRYCGDVFIYDPKTDTWSEGKPMLTARRNASAAVAEGRIYVIGGENERGALQVNEQYNPSATNQQVWQTVAPLPVSLAHPTVAEMLETIYVFDPSQRVVYLYTPSSDTWSVNELPQHIAAPSLVVPFRSSLFLFDTVTAYRSITVSEYQAVYRLFLPDVRR